MAEYARTNAGKYNFRNAKRHALKLKATPKWLMEEQYKEIETFYIKAMNLTKETDTKHEVDHIIPLQGRFVSGLHVPWNLQILTKLENSKKKNSFDFTYDNLSWSI